MTVKSFPAKSEHLACTIFDNVSLSRTVLHKSCNEATNDTTNRKRFQWIPSDHIGNSHVYFNN